LGGYFDIAGKRERSTKLTEEMARPDFWSDLVKAKEINKERRRISAMLEIWDSIEKALEDARVLRELAEEEDDRETASEADAKLEHVANELHYIEFQRMLGGENDDANVILSINSGAGGTEAQDWSEILLRMYLRWAEQREFKSHIIEIQPGSEAGIQGVTVEVQGPYAYGYLKAEVGVHRLVRISPFDSNHRRHTSFASVFVYPDIEEEIEIEIRDEDLRIDTYRASGHGGQKVNKTDSAVRITHLPTGIVAQCQNERSQHKNKATAMRVLRARLYQLEKERQNEKLNQLHSEKKDIDFGSQIRSYVLHPYRMVKDHRTGHETGNADAVLDGDLDSFMEAWLMAEGSGQ